VQLLVCVSNAGYEAALELRKLYQRLDDRLADKRGMVRVLDESGEDYLYPGEMFSPIRVTKRVAQQLFGRGASR
jgi:hypothetical protein